MGYFSNHLSQGVLHPEELQKVRAVYEAIASEAWFVDGQEARQAFAAYVIGIYLRGLTDPDRLRSFCRAAAESRFSKQHERPSGPQTQASSPEPA